MRRIIPLFLLLTLLLSACAGEERESDQGLITIYYAASDSVKDKSVSIGQESRPVENGSETLKTALKAVMGRPQNVGLKSPFAEGVTLLSHSINEGVLELHMSDTFADMREGDKVIARACLALTLCGLEGIDSISVFVGDVPDVRVLKAGDIAIANTELNPRRKRIRLYFAHSGESLKEELRDIIVDGERELAQYVMQELLAGPSGGELYSAIPAGTRLLSLTIEGRTCIVDLSHEFMDNRPQTELEEELAIYSIVNSLTALTTIDKVQFLIEGKKAELYYSIEIFNPITNNTDITA